MFGGITLLLGWHLQSLRFDFEFEKFFPKNDPDSRAYEAHKAQFGYDNDFLLLILSSENGVFDPDFLKKASQFEAEVAQIYGVKRMVSPLSQQHLVNGPTGLLAFPLLHIDEPERLPRDSLRIAGNPWYASSFGSDQTSYCIYVTHPHFADQEEGTRMVEEIKAEAQSAEIEQLRIVGKLTAQEVFLSYIQKDFGKYLLGSIALSFLLLLILFRSIRTSLLPFLISVFSLIWLFGLMGLAGVKINLLSSLLPPILFFASMSDAIHLMNALHKTRGNIQEAISIVWVPTLLTSVTTAIGFLSLLWINTQPIQTLGVFAAVGIVMAFIITFSFGLIFSTLGKKSASTLISIPPHFVSVLLRNRRLFLLGIFVACLLIIPGIYLLKVDAYLLDDLPLTSGIRQDFEFTDTYYGGSKPFEIRLEAVNGASIWEKEVMDEIQKVASYLENEFVVGRVLSPTTIISYLHQANNGGLNEHFQYPNDPTGYQRARRLIPRVDQRAVENLVTEDERIARIVGFIPELGSHETGIRNAKLLAYLDENIDASRLSYRLTGTTFLIDKSHELLSMNLLKGLLTAVITIGIVLGLYFKSFRLLLVSLIPNLIPLLLIAGLLGWMDVSLKMTTSIIFTVAFGIAVDDTIHMMSYFLKTKGKSPEEVLKKTFFHAGSAMLITSLIVIVGFSLFLFSQFGATFYLGLFVCLSLLIALIVDLTLLPILLLWISKRS